jgi:cytochrome c-type biogenesis protein CcmH
MEPIFFFLLLATLALLAGFFIFYPLFLAKNQKVAPSQADLNLAAYQQRLRELAQDVERGLLNQEQYATAKMDLDTQLLSDIPEQALEKIEKKLSDKRPWLSGSLLLALTISGSFLWYQQFGSWQGAQAETVRQQAAAQAAPQLPEDFVKAMESLAKRLQQGQGEWQEWLILAQSYALAQRFPEARRAYASAYQLSDGRLPTSAVLGYVEVLLLTDSTPDLPAQLLENLLASEPENLEALWFAGLVAMQQGQLPDSLRFWYQLLSLESRLRENPEIQGMINNVETAVAVATRERLQAEYLRLPEEKAEQAESGAKITVSVALSPEAAATVRGDEIVFVFAQAEGIPMPLAALRVPVQALPTTVTLDDSQAMLPDLRLSNFAQVNVSARLSKSGQATPQSGDWQGRVAGISVAESAVIPLQIDSVLP